MNSPTATHCLAVLAALLAAGCERPATSMVAPGGGGESDKQPLIEVVRVGRSDFQRVAEVPASIQANQMARLMSKLDGYVSDVLVDIGDRVQKGQPLARLSAPEMLADVDRKKAMVNQARQDAANYKSQIALAAAKVRQEQETLNLRNTEHENVKTLVDRGSLNRQKLDEAEFAKKSAQAAVERASAEVAANQAAHAAALAHIAVAEADQTMAERMSDYLTITAPFDGLITARNVDPGAFVEPATSGNGTPLFEIMQVDQLRVVLYVPMQQAGRLDVGDRVVLEKIEAHPGKRIESVAGQPLAITRISKSYDSMSRMMRAEIDLDNLALKNEMQFDLRPGDYGLARVILHRYDQVLAVPTTAVGSNQDADGETNFVMRVDANDKCYEEQVTVIMQQGDSVAIASDDVSTNDRVVVKDLDRVKHKESLAGRITTGSRDDSE